MSPWEQDILEDIFCNLSIEITLFLQLGNIIVKYWK